MLKMEHSILKSKHSVKNNSIFPAKTKLYFKGTLDLFLPRLYIKNGVRNNNLHKNLNCFQGKIFIYNKIFPPGSSTTVNFFFSLFSFYFPTIIVFSQNNPSSTKLKIETLNLNLSF